MDNPIAKTLSPTQLSYSLDIIQDRKRGRSRQKAGERRKRMLCIPGPIQVVVQNNKQQPPSLQTDEWKAIARAVKDIDWCRPVAEAFHLKHTHFGDGVKGKGRWPTGANRVIKDFLSVLPFGLSAEIMEDPVQRQFRWLWKLKLVDPSLRFVLALVLGRGFRHFAGNGR